MFNKGNMSKMLKQAQAMQSKMADVQEELNDIIIEESTSDLFTVKLNGKMDILDVQLSDDAMEEEQNELNGDNPNNDWDEPPPQQDNVGGDAVVDNPPADGEVPKRV